MADFDPERRRLVFKSCQTRQELHDWVWVFLDLDLPGTIVDPDSNTTPLDMVWDCYSHFVHGSEFNRRLYYSARDAGKTLSESVLEVMILIHLHLNIVHLAAIEEQSINAQRYLKDFLSKPDFRDFAGEDNTRTTEVIVYRPTPDDGQSVLTEAEWLELKSGKEAYTRFVSRAQIVVATMASVNGKHASLLCLDEIDVMKNPTVYKEAVNIPTAVRRGGRAILPLTVLTSTRKTSFGMVQEEINHAADTDLVVKHFNIFEVTERCPPERHRPDLPRLPIYRSNENLKAIDTKAFDGLSVREQKDYIKDEGWAGCLANCKMFAGCKGYLAMNQDGESEFLKPVQHVQHQFRTNSRDMAKAQLLCWKPSSTGLIYPSLEARRHVISPARAYEKVFGELPPDNLGGIEMTKAALVEALWEVDLEWWAGIDFGDSHNFATTLGFKFGRRGFVMRCKGGARLETPQQIELVEPLKIFDPKVWCDTSSPGSIRQFHANGWRTQEWKKGPGSLADGIAAVQTMLSPVMAEEPDLYFVRDVGDEDPEIDLLVLRMQQYHYKLDSAGRPTGDPDKTDDDECDSCRYGVMNAFPILQNRAGVEVVSEQVNAPPKGARYDEKNWVKQAISEATGKAWDGPASWGEAFKNPDGTPFFGDQKKAPRQQRGRLIVDVD